MFRSILAEQIRIHVFLHDRIRIRFLKNANFSRRLDSDLNPDPLSYPGKDTWSFWDPPAGSSLLYLPDWIRKNCRISLFNKNFSFQRTDRVYNTAYSHYSIQYTVYSRYSILYTAATIYCIQPLQYTVYSHYSIRFWNFFFYFVPNLK